MTLENILAQFQAMNPAIDKLQAQLNASIEALRHYIDSSSVTPLKSIVWRDKLVAKAHEGLKASWAENTPGFCSRWVRQVTERTFGYADHGLDKYFGADAMETGKKMRAQGKVPSYTRLVAGDILLQEEGSNGNGHVGIYIGDDKVAENSNRRRPDGRGICSLKEFGKITGVVRLEDITKGK